MTTSDLWSAGQLLRTRSPASGRRLSNSAPTRCAAAGLAPVPVSRCQVLKGEAGSHLGRFFLHWVLPGTLVTCVFAAQGWWDRAPGGRRWSLLAAVERRRTAQRRPSSAALDGRPAPSMRPISTSADDSQPRRRARQATTHACASLHPHRPQPRCPLVDRSKS